MPEILEVFLYGSLAVVVYFTFLWIFPPAIRPLFWAITRTLYRIEIYGADRVPRTGPVLLACNHVTYLDWLILWATCPRRISFVIWNGFDGNPVLRFGLSFARHRLIRIDNARNRPHAMAAALRAVADKLKAGEAVLIFPEGTLTRNGQMLPFGRGIEKVLKLAGGGVPVVPTHLDNLWGTLFSWHRGVVFWKKPAAIWRRIAVSFGEPLPGTSTAPEVRAAVVALSADTAIAESDRLLSAPRTFLRNAAAWRNLRRPAIVDASSHPERVLTWPRLLVGAWCLANWLRPRLGEDPHIGVWLPTGTGATLANVALSFLRKVSVNLNYTAGPAPVASAIAQADVRIVLTAKRFTDRVPLEVPAGVEVIYLEDALAGITGAAKLRAMLAVVLLPAWLLDRLIGLTHTKPDDVLTILFSSGSTGEPKGVMLTHRNVRSNGEGFRRGVDLRPSDIMLAVLPTFHSFGYTVCLWGPLVIGMKVVTFPDPRQAKEVGELCRKHACTILLGTATFLRLYLRRSGVDDFRSLRFLICGAEKLPVKLADEFFAKFAIRPLEGYGCTEQSPVVSTNLHDATVAGMTQKANVPGTIGQPIPGVAVRAVDRESKLPLPPETEGLLASRGPNTMLGYLNDPKRTAEVLVDGWYVSGDVGIVRADGFVQITGRVSRFAKIAGEMVPLEKLDAELHDVLGQNHDRVLVLAAVPDDKRGERVIVMHLPPVAEELPNAFAKLRERGLPNLWIPDVRDCHAVEEIPTLATGKLDLQAVGQKALAIAAT